MITVGGHDGPEAPRPKHMVHRGRRIGEASDVWQKGFMSEWLAAESDEQLEEALFRGDG